MSDNPYCLTTTLETPTPAGGAYQYTDAFYASEAAYLAALAEHEACDELILRATPVPEEQEVVHGP